jgi:hypothetical protein
MRRLVPALLAPSFLGLAACSGEGFTLEVTVFQNGGNAQQHTLDFFFTDQQPISGPFVVDYPDLESAWTDPPLIKVSVDGGPLLGYETVGLCIGYGPVVREELTLSMAYVNDALVGSPSSICWTPDDMMIVVRT